MKLLDKNELTRLGSKSGASEVKQHKWFSKINWGLLRHTKPPVSFAWELFSPRAPPPLLRLRNVEWLSLGGVSLSERLSGSQITLSANIKHVVFDVRDCFCHKGVLDDG